MAMALAGRHRLVLLLAGGMAFLYQTSHTCRLRQHFRRTSMAASGPRELPAASGMSVLVDFAMSRADTGADVGWSGVSSPLEFVAGAGDVPAPFEDAVLGMEPGDTKRVFGYGEPDDSGEELWEISGGKEPPCDVPIMLDITLLKAWARQDEGGVVVQSSRPGDGRTYPKVGDQLTVHYTGRLASSGQIFDSTYKRQYPFSFKIGLGKVIRGWEIGLMKMSEGEKATLIIPAAMAYGPRGVAKVIPPNSDLLFEVHLIKVRRY